MAFHFELWVDSNFAAPCSLRPSCSVLFCPVAFVGPCWNDDDYTIIKWWNVIRSGWIVCTISWVVVLAAKGSATASFLDRNPKEEKLLLVSPSIAMSFELFQTDGMVSFLETL